MDDYGSKNVPLEAAKNVYARVCIKEEHELIVQSGTKVIDQDKDFIDLSNSVLNKFKTNSSIQEDALTKIGSNEMGTDCEEMHEVDLKDCNIKNKKLNINEELEESESRFNECSSTMKRVRGKCATKDDKETQENAFKNWKIKNEEVDIKEELEKCETISRESTTVDTMTNPPYDIVLSLVETPFSTRNEEEKREIICRGRPIPQISTLKKDKKAGRQYIRSFQSSWYEIHSWICGSVLKQRLYCWPCLLLGKTKNVWTSDGYVDFKNFSRAVKIHDSSKEHIHNSLGFVRLSRNRSAIEDASEATARQFKLLYNEDVRKNRLLMTHLIDTAIIIGKQDLVLDETESALNKGNFQEIFNCLIKRNNELVHHLKDKHVFTGRQSKTIQNQLISCVCECMNDAITKEISNALFFSVIVDDTTDIVATAQCAVTIRYVNKPAEIKERFLGFFDVSLDARASALYTLLTTVSRPFNFEEKLVAQCYDGAAVTAGELSGLQARIKTAAPQALYTHCVTHGVNLLLQQGTRNIREARIFFATLNGLPSFFHKRTSILDKIIEKRVARAGDSGWGSKILFFVANNWDCLVLAFTDMVESKALDSETVHMAKGYLKELFDFEFAFLTFTFKMIFLITDQIFQPSNLDVYFCKSRTSTALSRLEEIRSENTVKSIIEHVKTLNCRDSKMSAMDLFQKYKALYFEILDCILFQINVRFDDLNKVEFVKLLNSQAYKGFSHNFPNDLLNSLENTYPKVFDKERLRNELSIIYRDGQFLNISVLDTVKLINELNLISVFSEVYKLAVLILTLPVTSVDAEPDFSCLKRIKSYLRNTISLERVDAMSLMSIEKELLVDLSENNGNFYDDIIDRFAALEDRRINLTYKK